MPLSLLITYLTFQVAIILIFKHAATLCLSGISAELALTQAELNYHQANIASKIQEHFTASYEEYSTEQFIGFLMDTNIGLSSLASIKIIADAFFQSHQYNENWKPTCKEQASVEWGYICVLLSVPIVLGLGLCILPTPSSKLSTQVPFSTFNHARTSNRYVLQRAQHGIDCEVL